MPPDEEESAALATLLTDLEKSYHESPELSNALTEGIQQEQLAAWTVVINTIFNLDITKTRQ